MERQIQAGIGGALIPGKELRPSPQGGQSLGWLTSRTVTGPAGLSMKEAGMHGEPTVAGL